MVNARHGDGGGKSTDVPYVYVASFFLVLGDHSGIGTCVCVAKLFLAVRIETSIGEPFVREDDVCLVDPFEDPLPVHAESGWASCTVRGQAVGGPVARVIS